MNLQEFLTFATLTLQNKEVIKEPKDSENTVFNEYVEYFKVIPNMLEYLITLKLLTENHSYSSKSKLRKSKTLGNSRSKKNNFLMPTKID